MKTGSLKIYSFHNFPYVRKCGMDNMVPRLDFIFTPFVMGMISDFFLFCNHLSSTNDTYLAMRRGKSYYGGKGYYIVRFPPGEKLLYSQFSGGKGYYGGKATIQHRQPRVFHANALPLELFR